MIRGVQYWPDERIRYSQSNNAIEYILKRTMKEEGINRGFYESCGASSFCTVAEGIKGGKNMPGFIGCQTDDLVMIMANNKKGGYYIDGTNRNLHAYEKIANEIFDLEYEYCRDKSFEDISEYLKQGKGVVKLLKRKDKPGHYVALIAYDLTTEEILYHDPWDTNPINQNGGKFERMGNAMYDLYSYYNRALVLWE